MLEFQQQFLNLLYKHQNRCFYVGDNIPQKKLENAIAFYPVPRNLLVLGLIDTTVLGSCKNGLAITQNGIIWHNDWTTKSSKTSLTWEELLKIKNELKVDRYDIDFGSGIRFNTAGSGEGPVKVLNLLLDIVEMLEDTLDKLKNQKNDFVEKKATPPKLPQPVSTNDFANEQDIYEKALILSFALMVGADGKVETAEIELVTAFIEEEKSIKDKHKALSDFETSIGELCSSYEKSKALFQLKSAKMLAGIKKIQNQEILNLIEIMLEGMVEAAGGVENVATVEMMKKIMSQLK